MKLDEKLMIDRWGNEVAYYRDKALFLKKHMAEGATLITSNEEEPVLIGATYYFTPYTVAYEHIQLVKKLGEMAKA